MEKALRRELNTSTVQKVFLIAALTLFACYSALVLQETHKAATFPSAFYLVLFAIAAVWFGTKSLIVVVTVMIAALIYPPLHGKAVLDVYDSFRLIAFPLQSIVVIIVGESSLRVSGKWKKSRDFLENIFDHANALIIVWDNDMRITMFNRAAEKFTGYKASEITGQSPAVLFPPDKRDEFIQCFRFATLMVEPEAIEIPLLSKSQVVRMVIWNFAEIHDVDGVTPIGTVAMGQDITDRKIAEKALEETNKLSREPQHKLD